MSKRVAVKKLAYIALFTALIIVGGFVRIPIGTIPITLQTLFVLLAGSIGGKRVGVSAVIIYIVIGLIGVPVFSAGGGIFYVLKPSFGYLIGFIFASLIAGVPKRGVVKRLLFNLLAVAVVHVIGVIYFYLIYLENLTSVWQVILTGSIVFLPFDIISAMVASFVANKVYPIVNK